MGAQSLIAGKINELIQAQPKAVSLEQQTRRWLRGTDSAKNAGTLVPSWTLGRGYLIRGSPEGRDSWPHKVWTSFSRA